MFQKSGKANGNSSDDHDQGRASKDGTYYINNITNNIIVDKKSKDCSNQQNKDDHENDKQENKHHRQCTCHLKH